MKYDKPLKFDKPLYVTRPFLPDLDGFCDGLRVIWEDGILTNEAANVQRLTKRMEEKFGDISLFVNGTLALQLGLQALEVSGEVITTPFTFVATAHALFWNKLKPVFVDIEPDYYTIDPAAVEAAITPQTTAILAVHVYGFPCRLAELAAIAKKHDLKLIYDAAHAFGVEVDGQPISNYGDLSMFSFHATKLFHSIEGGMLVFQSPELANKLNHLKNFGFDAEDEVTMAGTNAKMNEFQALMGLKVLEHVDEIIDKSRAVYECYRENLKSVPGISLAKDLPASVKWNYSYMPVEVDEKEFGLSRDALYLELRALNVFVRKYFYPLVCDFACYKDIPVEDSLPVARNVASRIMTLPIYPDLDLRDVERICQMIRFLQQDEDIIELS